MFARLASQGSYTAGVTETTMFTIGYQGASLEGVIDALADAGVSVLVDTRETPMSRRVEFRPKALRSALAQIVLAARESRDRSRGHRGDGAESDSFDSPRECRQARPHRVEASVLVARRHATDSSVLASGRDGVQSQAS
jgi:uncharacterized protein (DUF488 family)